MEVAVSIFSSSGEGPFVFTFSKGPDSFSLSFHMDIVSSEGT